MPLALLIHEDSAAEKGRKMAEKLKKEIPRHQFEIPIQAAIGNKVIARETISHIEKTVLAKCYGGDISRKKKLLEKRKKDKKRCSQDLVAWKFHRQHLCPFSNLMRIIK